MGPSVRKQSSQGKGNRVVEFALRLNVLSSMTSELWGYLRCRSLSNANFGHVLSRRK